MGTAIGAMLLIMTASAARLINPYLFTGLPLAGNFVRWKPGIRILGSLLDAWAVRPAIAAITRITLRPIQFKSRV